MAIRIQLDSTALASLIEDEDFFVELKNSVIQSFAKKYIKPLFNNEDFSRTTRAGFKQCLDDEIKKMILKSIKDEICEMKLDEMINNCVVEQLDGIVNQSIKEYFKNNI